MSVLASITKLAVPVNREGYPFVAGAGVVTLAAFLWFPWLFWPLAIVTAWCVYFFRDPPRVTPVKDGLVISPADGVVSLIASALPPPELDLSDRPLTRVSVFMNVFDCHVNRSPVTGRITRIAYKKGLFLSADLDKASDDNERNGFVIETPEARFGVVQIAGLVARRIVPFAREGATVAVGERIGMIRFGSRVDIYLPDGVRPLVGIGQTMIAGETVIADTRVTTAALAHKVG